MENRNYKLDALKMVLIVLVIFGHVPLMDGLLDIGIPNSYDFFTHHAMAGIYAFHMPLFILISGYFSKHKPIKKQFLGSLKLLKLYAIFQIIDLLIVYFIGNEKISIQKCLYPCFALWYLLCLFYWRILITIIPKEWDPKYVVIVSFILSLAVGFTKIDGIMGLHRFFSFMPYFLIGYYFGKKILQIIEKESFRFSSKKIVLIALFFIILIVVSFNPYWLTCIISPYSSGIVFFIRISYLIYSLLLCYLLVLIISFKRSWENSYLARTGSYTLFFYLIHPYILYSVLITLSHFGNKSINIIDTIFIVLVTIIILYLINKSRIFNFLLK